MDRLCNQERDVTLMLNEMQINKELEYDESLNTYLGRINEEVVVCTNRCND
jgi:hypothetical protein